VPIGTRDLEDYRQERLAASRLTVAGRTVDPGELGGALDDVRQHVGRVYCTFNRFEVSAAALTACDPRVDGSGSIATAARAVSHHIARLAASNTESL
jgi:hypothetical protein